MLAAVVLTVVVGVLRAAITPWVGERIPLGLFFAGTLVAAWLGGFWPGVLATALGALTGTWFFIPPADGLIPTDPGQWLGILLFVGIGVAISAGFEALIRARERAEADRQALRGSEARLATTLEQRDRAEQDRRDHEAELAVRAGALARLNDASSRLWRLSGLNEGLDEMLAASIQLLGADMGNVQLLDAGRGVLRIAVHRGFQPEFLEFFREVSIRDVSACARALSAGERLVIEDVDADAAFAPLRAIARSAGYRAVQSTPLIGRDGKPLGMLSTHWRSVHRPAEQDLRLLDLYARQAADFIERSQIDGALRESDRRKDEYLAVLAHELRNPLAPIRSAARFLGMLDLPDPDWKRPVEMIERQVTHMARLIDDLLDVSRMATGVFQLRLQEVDVNEVVRSALEACRVEVDARAHVVHLSLPSPPVRLRADRDRLMQVFCNLISNAAKFTGHEGTIHVDARIAGDTLEIAVRDSGRGIPGDQLARVFDLFVQVDRALDGQGGLGIGLTLARQLVELHGGTIDASSDGIGRGSTFVVRLPIVAGSAVPKPGWRPARAVEPRRVLLVDDSRDAAESLALLLETSGHETRVAFDGEAALEAAADFLPEVAILDIGMPKLNGYELAQRLRAQAWGKSIYLVALTGWGQESDQERAREAGFDAHLVKPAAFESVARIMERPRDAVR